MKPNIFYKIAPVVFAVVILQSCSLKEVINPSKAGNTSAETKPDFSKFISIGDSQTSGQANDGLYREAQLSSFPAIIAAQLASVGGGNFYQPLFETAQANGTGYLKLNGFKPDGSPIITRVTDNLAVRGAYNGLTLLSKHAGNLSNFGVTGIARACISAYNTTIANIAAQKKLALFDVNALSNLLKQGQVIDGVAVNSTFITGGVFSLDGIHLTPRGYALEANEFIKTINAKYGTNIKTVNIAGYAGVIP